MSGLAGLRHVAINAVFLQRRFGGLETYIKRLVPAVVEAAPGLRLSIFVNEEAEGWLRDEPWADSVRLVTHPLLGRRYLRAASEIGLLGPLARREGADLLYSAAMIGPLAGGPVHVVAVHDLIWLHHPDPGDRVTNLLWRTLIPRVARRAARVLTGSEAVRAQIAGDLHVAPENIDVVPHGRGAEPVTPTPAGDLRERLGLGAGPVVLTVSAKRRHKNLVRLLRAIARISEAHPDAQLVLPGNPTPHEAVLKEEAVRLGIADRVHFPAYVSAEDLEGLYAVADCFVIASLNEGFGLPVLEAMARGVPVACARASSLPEVAGDAARYFDPLSEDSIAAAIAELLGDRDVAARLAEAGRARAASFTWRAAAEGTLRCWERALANGRGRA